MPFNWSSVPGGRELIDSIKGSITKVDPTGEFCLLNVDERTVLQGFGECELSFEEVVPVILPGACNTTERGIFLKWMGSPAQCAANGGETCNYTWSRDYEACAKGPARATHEAMDLIVLA